MLNNYVSLCLMCAALGMNEEELKANKEASEYVVHDLNLELTCRR